MAEIYWPVGVEDDPLVGVSVTPVENAESFEPREGQFRMAPVNLGQSVLMTATFPMSWSQFNGIWWPWWMNRKTLGGADNGAVAFWLRDPFTLKPMRWIRQPKQQIRIEQDGAIGRLITLPLVRLPS